MRTCLAILAIMLAVRCEGQEIDYKAVQRFLNPIEYKGQQQTVWTNPSMERLDALETEIRQMHEFLDKVKAESERIIDLLQVQTNDAPLCAGNICVRSNLMPLAKVSNTFHSARIIAYNVRSSPQCDDIIRELAKDGTICKAIGHRWEQVPHMTLEYRPDGNYPKHRKCSICGKEETFEVKGEWK